MQFTVWTGGGSGEGAAPPREQTLNRGPNDMVVCVCNLPYEKGFWGSGAPGEAKGAAGEAKVSLWKASVFALRQAKYGWFRTKSGCSRYGKQYLFLKNSTWIGPLEGVLGVPGELPKMSIITFLGGEFVHGLEWNGFFEIERLRGDEVWAVCYATFLSFSEACFLRNSEVNML